MKPILEYLLSKSNAKNNKSSGELVLMFKDIFSNESDKFIKEMVDIIDNHMDKKNFGSYRIISNSEKINDIIADDTKLLMTNLAETNGIIEELFDDIIGNMPVNKITTIQGYDYDYDIYLEDTFIYVSDNEFNILIDTVADGEDFDPKINTYYVDHNEAIELSSRSIGYEIDNKGDTELFWDEFNEMCDRYIQDFEDETDIELVIGGRNGKHVCARGSYKLIHNLNKYIKLVNDYQNNLVEEMNEFIEVNLNNEEE